MPIDLSPEIVCDGHARTPDGDRGVVPDSGARSPAHCLGVAADLPSDWHDSFACPARGCGRDDARDTGLDSLDALRGASRRTWPLSTCANRTFDSSGPRKARHNADSCRPSSALAASKLERRSHEGAPAPRHASHTVASNIACSVDRRIPLRTRCTVPDVARDQGQLDTPRWNYRPVLFAGAFWHRGQ